MADSTENNKSQDSVLSERDDRLLSYLAWICQTLKNDNKPRNKKFREVFREPTVVATLITVLIGGIAATSITGIIQWRSGEREFLQTMLKARNDRQLASYNEYLTQEQTLMNRVYGLIGMCTSASQRLIGLTGAKWRQRPTNQVQVTEIINNFNSTRGKWNSEVFELGQLMSYYHPEFLQSKNDPHQPSQSDELFSWTALQGGVSTYLKCASDWKTKYSSDKPAPTDHELENACAAQYEALGKQLNKFTATLISSRRYAWQNWEIPQETTTIAPTFRERVKSALLDGSNVATAIILFLIKAVVGLLPLIIFALAVWVVSKRIRRRESLEEVQNDKARAHEESARC